MLENITCGRPKIVSLLPSATEIVGRLGLGNCLIAVSHECDMCPDEEGMKQILPNLIRCTSSVIDPSSMSQRDINSSVRLHVGNKMSLYAFDYKSVMNLLPTVVLTQSLCDVCAPSTVDVDSASELHFPKSCKIVNLEPKMLEDVAQSFKRVAEACGVEDRGIQLCTEFLGGFSALRDVTSAASSESRPPRVLLLEWLDPPFDAGHWNPTLIAAAGGEAILNTTPGSKSRRRTWNEVEAADPDVVVVACCGFDLQRNIDDTRRVLRSVLEFKNLRAVKNGRLYCADGSKFFARPSPSLLQAACALAMCLYEGEETAKHVQSLGIVSGEEKMWVSYKKIIKETADVSTTNEPNDAINVEDCWVRHKKACEKGDSFYEDPISGLSVMTRFYLETRGKCCGSGCRHCPYTHENVSMERRASRIQSPAYIYTREKPRIRNDDKCEVLFWSGGKDSFLALRNRANELCSTENIVLLTTFDAVTRVVAHQEVPLSCIVKQAKHLDLDLIGIPLHPGIEYSKQIAAGLDVIKGVPHSLVFGDLHLMHIRQWRDEHLSSIRIHVNEKLEGNESEELVLELLYPLWNKRYLELKDDLRKSGVPCKITACEKFPDVVGMMFGSEAFSDVVAERGWDEMGENGEFHTLACVWEVEKGRECGMQLEIAKRRSEELEVLGSMQFPGFTILKQDGRGDGVKEGFVVDVNGDGSCLTAWMPEGYPLDGSLLCSSTGEGGREVLGAVQAAARDAALEGVGAEHGLQVILAAQAAAVAAIASKESLPSTVFYSPSPVPRLARKLVHFHHIIAKSKRHAILEGARELDIGGVCKIGWPGLLVVEGPEDGCNELVRQLRRLKWQMMKIRGEELAADGEQRVLPFPLQEIPDSGGVAEAARICDEAKLRGLFDSWR